jgi:long-subunit fatty acid transport protein
MTKNQSKLLAVSLLTVLMAAGSAVADTALDAIYGTPEDGASARSLAMGLAGVATFMGSSAVVQNPALLATIDSRAHLDFQVGIREANEDRFVPLYDTFDDLVAETAYALNRNSYASAQGGLVLQLPGEGQGAISVGLYDRYDADFDYEEEVRSTTTDELEQFNRLSSDGRLRSLSFGYGREILPSIHLGLAAHRYFGTFTQVTEELPLSPVPGNLRFRGREQRELAGWGYTVGAQFTGHERLDLGVSIEGPFTVSGNHTLRWYDGTSFLPVTGAPAEGDYEIDYPTTVAFGFAYHPRNDLRTVFTAEARRRFWEKLDDGWAEALAPGTDLGLRNTWDFRMGVEHLFYNGMPARFGFRFVENYADRDSDRVVFSTGTGYAFEAFRVDLTGQYTRQTSRQDFLFGSGASGVPNPLLTPKVEDSGIRFTMGVSREF